MAQVSMHMRKHWAQKLGASGLNGKLLKHN